MYFYAQCVQQPDVKLTNGAKMFDILALGAPAPLLYTPMHNNSIELK